MAFLAIAAASDIAQSSTEFSARAPVAFEDKHLSVIQIQDVINNKTVPNAPIYDYTYLNYDCARNGAGTKKFPSCKQIRSYQIILWFSISLAVIAVVAISALLNMPFKQDTLLYGNMNPSISKKNH